jgi:hypothetical protein
MCLQIEPPNSTNTDNRTMLMKPCDPKSSEFYVRHNKVVKVKGTDYKLCFEKNDTNSITAKPQCDRKQQIVYDVKNKNVVKFKRRDTIMCVEIDDVNKEHIKMVPCSDASGQIWQKKTPIK